MTYVVAQASAAANCHNLRKRFPAVAPKEEEVVAVEAPRLEHGYADHWPK